MLNNPTISAPVDTPTGEVKVDSSHYKGSGALDQTMENMVTSQSKPQLKQRGNEEKAPAVHEEMQRMNQLPPNSTYVTHRLRVLNKILQLLSIKRTVSQEEELELLFAGLHM